MSSLAYSKQYRDQSTFIAYASSKHKKKSPAMRCIVGLKLTAVIFTVTLGAFFAIMMNLWTMIDWEYTSHFKQKIQESTIGTTEESRTYAPLVYGYIEHINKKLCLTVQGMELIASECRDSTSQFFTVADGKEIRKVLSEYCIQADEDGSTIEMGKCHGKGANQRWQITDTGKLYHATSKKCISLIGATPGATTNIKLELCAKSFDKNQDWWFLRKWGDLN